MCQNTVDLTFFPDSPRKVVQNFPESRTFLFLSKMCWGLEGKIRENRLTFQKNYPFLASVVFSWGPTKAWWDLKITPNWWFVFFWQSKKVAHLYSKGPMLCQDFEKQEKSKIRCSKNFDVLPPNLRSENRALKSRTRSKIAFQFQIWKFPATDFWEPQLNLSSGVAAKTKL